MVFLQAVDECNSIDRAAAQRLLNVPNLHTTGHIHGVLPSHVGMRSRLTVKLNSTLGLVQEQKGTIVDFLFKDEDRERYNQCAPGQLFRPRYLPAGGSRSVLMEAIVISVKTLEADTTPKKTWKAGDLICCFSFLENCNEVLHPKTTLTPSPSESTRLYISVVAA